MNYHLLDPRRCLWAIVSEVRGLLLAAGASNKEVRHWAAGTVAIDSAEPINTWSPPARDALLQLIKHAGFMAEPQLRFEWATEEELELGIAAEVAANVNILLEV